MKLTGDTDSINVIWNDTLRLDDLVELGSGTVQYNGIQSDAGEKAQAKRELVDLLEHSSANLDDRKLGRLRRMGRGTEDAQIALDLPLGPNRVQKPCDRVLVGLSVKRMGRRIDSPDPRRSCSGSGTAPARTPYSCEPWLLNASRPHI